MVKLRAKIRDFFPIGRQKTAFGGFYFLKLQATSTFVSD